MLTPHVAEITGRALPVPGDGDVVVVPRLFARRSLGPGLQIDVSTPAPVVNVAETSFFKCYLRFLVKLSNVCENARLYSTDIISMLLELNLMLLNLKS